MQKKSIMLLAPTLKINANYLSIYNTIVEGKSEVCKTSAINFVDNFHDCKMSAAAVKTIKKATNVILYLARRKHYQEKYRKLSCTGYRKNDLTERAKIDSRNMYLCTFITLTLPAEQKHTDKEITEFCINPFLAYARKYFKIRYYVWKKELQQNGNLHYHFITDRYVDALCLRRAWNRCINRGYIEGIKNPFDYVQRYHEKQLKFYADGWNDEKMYNYFAANQNVIDKAELKSKEIEIKEKRNISFIEYQKILDKEIQTAFERAKNIYHNEMSKPESKRFTNPNTTDIKAVSNPRTMSAYISKYIAKDIDDNPEILNYQKDADTIKNFIYETLRTIAEKKENAESVDDDFKTLENYKNELKKHRIKCPISGKLWYKSATLTPFLKGASDFIYNDLDVELRKLIDLLNKRSEGKKNNLVLYNYELNPDGTENKDKIICITLLIDIFELQTLFSEGKHYKLFCPTIVKMWQKFIYQCIQENRKKGLYEDFKKDFEEFETIKK